LKHGFAVEAFAIDRVRSAVKVERGLKQFHGVFMEEALKCLHLLKAMGYTMADHVEEDTDLENMPAQALDALCDILVDRAPAWGNVMVM